MMITRQLRNSAIFVAFTGLILAAAVSLEGALAWTTFRPHPRRSATATASRRTDPAPLSPTRPCVTQAISSSSLFRSSPASSSNWRPSLVTLHAAAPSSGGFGKSKAAGGKKKTASSSSSTSGSNAESSKLKPKQQWDRYMELKGCPKIKVGIRATNKKGDGSAADWLEVGHVKFQEDVGAQVAVARQRALIAEHAKRLYPLQVSPKDTLEWGYRKVDDDSAVWSVADKSALDGVDPKGLDRRIGFEGTADPSTGYYCFYNEGRLVNGAATDGDLPAGMAVSTKPRKQL